MSLVLWRNKQTDTRSLIISSNKLHSHSVGLYTEQKNVEFKRLADVRNLEHTYEKLRSVYGCLGLFAIGQDVSLVVITRAERVGRIRRAPIYRVLGVKFYSLFHLEHDWVNSLESSTSQGGHESSGTRAEHPCAVAEHYLSSGNFYFSYDYDMTLSTQEFHQLEAAERNKPDPVRKSLWHSYDTRFFWNRYLLRDLARIKDNLDAGLCEEVDRTHILVLVTQGFVEIYERNIGKDRLLQCGVLSRLSCERAGTRFLTRGIDDEGNVANFVETEQLFVFGDMLFSFVQVRGSVPSFWEQRGVQLGLTVDLVRDVEASKYAFRKHFESLVSRYGTVRIVNLLSSRNAEASLSRAYESLWRSMRHPNVNYTPFDFNHHCRSSNYQNIDILLHSLIDDINSFGYFVFDYAQNLPVMLQKGTFRVNCLDCLDRTNVIESSIALKVLDMQWQVLRIHDIHPEFLSRNVMNTIWANNADALSRISTGTGALKSGFTRTGRRTFTGLIDDARKAVNRFYVNNFLDHGKQEIIDILLGNLATMRSMSPLIQNPSLDQLEKQLVERRKEFTRLKDFCLFIGSWNVNRSFVASDGLEPWISCAFQRESVPDILAIGLQEVAGLNQDQMFQVDQSRKTVLTELLLTTINRLAKQRHAPFLALRAEQLGGTCLFVYVQEAHIKNIRNVYASSRKTGMAGIAANKGTVAIRLDWFETSFVFVSSHFAAGQLNSEDRDRDYHAAMEIVFPFGLKITDHHNVFWFGDLNYRVDLPYSEVMRAVVRNEFASLLPYDQLGYSRKQASAFEFFSEGNIGFPPTYKFDVGTNQYDTSEKFRTPSWTDRILWCGTMSSLVEYTSCPTAHSDHRPVYAKFRLKVKAWDDASSVVAQNEISPPSTSEPSAIDLGETVSPSPRPYLALEKNLIDLSIEESPPITQPVDSFGSPGDLGIAADGVWFGNSYPSLEPVSRNPHPTLPSLDVPPKMNPFNRNSNQNHNPFRD